MHIEPGVLTAAKVLSANAAALATLGAHVRPLLRRPADLVKIGLAATFFSIFMQVYHAPVGPSELHFIGASVIYFLFGFLPTLFGFALGLLLQGLLFEPGDLVHLGVNSLSLMVPLIAAHALLGRHFFAEGEDKARVRWTSVMKFDAVYYSGVVTMVGFWLLLGEEATPLRDWALFALAYLPIVLCEPVLTFAVLKLLGKLDAASPVRTVTEIDRLKLA